MEKQLPQKTSSLRRRPILLLCAIFLILFYVTPIYEFIGNGIQNHLDLVTSVSHKVDSSVNLCQHFPCFQHLWGKKEYSYLVNTEACKILDLDPFDTSVKKYLKKGHSMKCKDTLVSVKSESLVINKDVARNWKYSGATCCYRIINRVTQSLTSYNKNADWTVSISDKCHPIPNSNGTVVDVPYIKIECKNGHKLKSGIQFEGVVISPSKLSNSTAEKTKKWDNFKKEDKNSVPPPSILIIGIDSISRLHMYRQLPQTRKYLDAHDFVEMRGYTKVGENTFPNIMAAIGGMSSYQYPCWHKREDKMDACPFLWKNFSQVGYLTALLEDAPGIAIFNYEKTGFVAQPTDYYLRPVMAAAHLHDGRAKNSGSMSCFGGVNPTIYMMNYIKRFLSVTGNHYPYFLLSWFTNIGHDDFNGLQTADTSFRDFLKNAVENPAYGGNNTVIFFISDHGYRFGAFRETFLGFYEESLPFFYIRMPPNLKKRFPSWVNHLKENSHRLTTPLDVYETLKDILNISSLNGTTGLVETQVNNTERANVTEPIFDFPRESTFRDRYSFFEKAPTNRSCESSGIPQRYCMCGVTPEVDKKSDTTIHLAKIVISQVNDKQLKSVISKDQCHILKFSKVLYGRQLLPGEVWNNFGKLEKFQDYIVAFEANPGKGHFEARVRVYENGTEGVLDSVSRINSYEGQGNCMGDYVLKNYCMCKKLVPEKTKG